MVGLRTVRKRSKEHLSKTDPFLHQAAKTETDSFERETSDRLVMMTLGRQSEIRISEPLYLFGPL
jgi:hypothetical protein